MVQSRLGGSRLTMGGAYLERKCRNKECGKRFMCTQEHAYGFFCSWHCLRESEKADGRKNKHKPETSETEIYARIKKCKDCIAHYKQAADAAGVNTSARNSAMKSVREWTYRLEDAQERLAQFRGREKGKTEKCSS